MSNVVPVGKAAQAVVISLTNRINFKKSVEKLKAEEEAKKEEEFQRTPYGKRLESERGRALITKGLALIRDNESADAAIAHLRNELAAISGEATVGSEEF